MLKTEHVTGRSIFFSLRAVLHSFHSCFTSLVSSNAHALAQGLINQVSMCAFSTVILSSLGWSQPLGLHERQFSFPADWRPNRALTATILAAELGLAEWPNSPRSKVLSPTL